MTSLGDKATVLVLVEERYRSQEQPAALITALRADGHVVHVIDDSTTTPTDPTLWSNLLRTVDVAVLRGRSLRLLDQARTLMRAGIPLVDPPQAVDAVRDKIVMDLRLTRHGVPTPLTWAGSTKDVITLVTSLDPTARNIPLICKPVLGDNARGIQVLESAAQLADLPWDHDRMIVQHYLPSDGMDLKLYVIGQRIFAVRKPSPLLASDAPSEPVEVTATMVDIVDRCRQAFDLTVFGVDCVQTGGLQTDDGLRVIEVNDFPNFSAVPDAGRLLADHVLSRRAPARAKTSQEA